MDDVDPPNSLINFPTRDPLLGKPLSEGAYENYEGNDDTIPSLENFDADSSYPELGLCDTNVDDNINFVDYFGLQEMFVSTSKTVEFDSCMPSADDDQSRSNSADGNCIFIATEVEVQATTTTTTTTDYSTPFDCEETVVARACSPTGQQVPGQLFVPKTESTIFPGVEEIDGSGLLLSPGFQRVVPSTASIFGGKFVLHRPTKPPHQNFPDGTFQDKNDEVPATKSPVVNVLPNVSRFISSSDDEATDSVRSYDRTLDSRFSVCSSKLGQQHSEIILLDGAYRAKRTKNNIAVRKSRAKKRCLDIQKEEKILQYEGQLAEKDLLIIKLLEEKDDLKEENSSLLAKCAQFMEENQRLKDENRGLKEMSSAFT